MGKVFGGLADAIKSHYIDICNQYNAKEEQRSPMTNNNSESYSYQEKVDPRTISSTNETIFDQSVEQPVEQPIQDSYSSGYSVSPETFYRHAQPYIPSPVFAQGDRVIANSASFSFSSFPATPSYQSTTAPPTQNLSAPQIQQPGGINNNAPTFDASVERLLVISASKLSEAFYLTSSVHRFTSSEKRDQIKAMATKSLASYHSINEMIAVLTGTTEVIPSAPTKIPAFTSNQADTIRTLSFLTLELMRYIDESIDAPSSLLSYESLILELSKETFQTFAFLSGCYRELTEN